MVGGFEEDILAVGERILICERGCSPGAFHESLSNVLFGGRLNLSLT